MKTLITKIENDYIGILMGMSESVRLFGRQEQFLVTKYLKNGFK